MEERKQAEERRINPDMILLARRARGMSQKELADAVNLSQGYIWKLEVESKAVPESILGQISSVLGFPPEFFFESGNIYHSISPHYRKRAALPARKRESTEAMANIQRMHIGKLLRSFEINVKIKQFDLEEYENSPEKIAQAVRQLWVLPAGPIQNATNAIERAGVIILKCDFETSLLDAFTISDSNNPPIIFINSSLTGDRTNFSLAHEVGHISMHSFFSEDMESQADRFAAEFLMPKDDIYDDLRGLELPKLAILKKKWKVSMAALLYRAKTLKTITENQYFYFVKKMSAAGLKKREPPELDIPIDEPQLIKKLIEMHFQEMNIDSKKLSEVLRLSESEFKQLYLKNDEFTAWKNLKSGNS